MEKNYYILNIEEFSLYLQAEKIFSEGTILLYKTVLERFFQFCNQNQNELVLPKTWSYSDTVSYTHLTLPTICSV